MAKARVSREGSAWVTPTICSNTPARKTCSCLLPASGSRRESFHAWRSSDQTRLSLRPTPSPPTRPATARDGDPGSTPSTPPSPITSKARVVVPGPNPPDLDRAPAQGGQDQPLAQEVAPRVAEGVRLGRHVRAVRGGPGGSWERDRDHGGPRRVHVVWNRKTERLDTGSEGSGAELATACPPPRLAGAARAPGHTAIGP